jgi:hypothetical protein
LTLSVYASKDGKKLLSHGAVGLELEIEEFSGQEVGLPVRGDVQEMRLHAGVGLNIELHTNMPLHVALTDQWVGPEPTVLPNSLPVTDRISFEANREVLHVTESVAVFMPKTCGTTQSSCRAPFFTIDRRIDAESLRSGWESMCAEVPMQFVELFPNHRTSQETLLKWVET